MEIPDLIGSWAAFAGRLRGAVRVAVFCDDDGTLLPPADPSAPEALPPETLKSLRRLSESQGVTLAFVSGRPVSELRSLIPVSNAWFAGLYGHEIRNPQGLERRWYTKKESRRIGALGDAIERELSSVPGLRVIRKGGSMRVDYGAVEAARLRDVQDGVLRLWRSEGKGLRLWPGPRSFEILASENRVKGTAVRFILGKIAARTLPIYFGDDDTDLEAFRALRRLGIGIGVGNVVSPHLDFRLAGPSEVGVALRRLADLLEKRD